ncbi:MAG TPA: 50S ribosomal protein L6 [Caldithrix abyssi]|uniref:Large ribosomal subunit protein uL6 n=1 Tax=Caldithrix abyssi TaxID=187145 RepID=A0A7V4UC42_CALAY|nr:50S ribosomal protein L6 [Caldithrix abyssi]
MSRIGKLPVNIPQNVTVEFKENNTVAVKGPKGELTRQFSDKVELKVEDGQVLVNRKDDSKSSRALHGLSRALLANMVTGVSEGFTRKLEIVGVGYKAEMKGKKLLLTIGYSHPIIMSVPDNIQLSTPSPTEITVTGIDKELVGMVAAKIRSFRKPEPYKGKGIKYAGEYIRRKAGKTAGK